MDTQVQIETSAFTGTFTFSHASVVARTQAAIVVALTNDEGERLVITLPKAALKQLGDWRSLF